MSEPFHMPDDLREVEVERFNRSRKFPTEPIEELFDAVETYFQGEEELKDEKNRILGNPIFNRGNSGKDRDNMDNGIGRYSNTRELLTAIEAVPEVVWMAARRVSLDVWIGFLCGFLNLDNYGKWKTIIPNFGD